MDPERKVRRDAKLKDLPEPLRVEIAEWLAEDGADACLRRIQAELGTTVSQSTLYETLAYWRSQARYNNFSNVARAQAELEAEAKGGVTPQEMEELVDRNFLMLAAEKEDTALYMELRNLRIRDQESKGNARIAQAKLKQGEQKIAQQDRNLTLAERRVKLLEDNAREAKAKLQEITSSRGGLTPETLAKIEEAAALL